MTNAATNTCKAVARHRAIVGRMPAIRSTSSITASSVACYARRLASAPGSPSCAAHRNSPVRSAQAACDWTSARATHGQPGDHHVATCDGRARVIEVVAGRRERARGSASEGGSCAVMTGRSSGAQARRRVFAAGGIATKASVLRPGRSATPRSAYRPAHCFPTVLTRRPLRATRLAGVMTPRRRPMSCRQVRLGTRTFVCRAFPATQDVSVDIRSSATACATSMPSMAAE